MPIAFPRHVFKFAVAVLVALSPGTRGENIVFPEDAGVINVRDLGAKGDGASDDTAAIQQAISKGASNGVVFVPNGTYLVSSTLQWTGRATRTILQGQSRDGTVIKLKDRCQGFTNPGNPRAVIVTGFFPPQRFRNAIRNLTVNTGKQNHGAIGIRFNASNQGQMNTVSIRSGDGSGVIGLDMGYTGDVGPLLVRDLSVSGFDVGVYTAHATAYQTLEHVSLEDQRLYGWVNDGQTLAIRDLRSVNRVPALWNKLGASAIALLDADLRGRDEASDVPAIINDEALYARNIRTTGYKMAIDGSVSTGRSVEGASVDEFSSHGVQKLFPSPDRSLRLPVEETPTVPWDDPRDWVSVAQFAPKTEPGQKADWTEAVQKAIDSGATTVYFPHSKHSGHEYNICGPVYIRGKVRRIIGMETEIGRKQHTEFILQDGAWPAVVVERFDWLYCPVIFRTNSKRTLVIKALNCYLDVGPGGRVFLEDGVFHFKMSHNSKVWIRQFNTEYTHENRHSILWPRPLDIAEHPGNLNAGGDLWVLGTKLEGDGRLLTTTSGGRSEVLGGLVYANKNSFAQKRAFVVDDSSLSLSVGEWVGRDQPFHMIEERRAGETRLREPAAPPRRGAGSLCTLFSGYRGPRATNVFPKPSFDPETGPGHGKGLNATYFSGEFEGLLRTGVEAVDVDFAASPPTAGRYSARWSGKIESRHTGMHHFTLDSVGTRLLIDGRLVVDAWRNNARYRNGRIHLAAGRRYDIKLEHRSDGSTHGKVRLIWSVPGHSQEVVPACQLYPADERLPQVRLTASDDCMPEQGGAVTLTAHRTGDTSKPLTVALLPRHDMTMNLTMIYAARGDAIAKQDYDGAPLELVIPAGESSKGFALRARDDPYPERPEHVLLELAPSHDYDIASRQLTVCIEDDDMPTPGSGTGLRGEYFTGKNFTDLVETRVDKQLDFNWDKRVPARGQEPRNGYSIRWTGRIQPLFSETYLIQAPTSVYSATRVWLDGEEIITFSNEGAEPNGRFGKRGSGVTYARVPLKSGRKYDLRVEYVALNFYGQKFKLLWSSDSQFEQVVPPCQLYPSGD